MNVHEQKDDAGGRKEGRAPYMDIRLCFYLKTRMRVHKDVSTAGQTNRLFWSKGILDEISIRLVNVAKIWPG